MIFHPSPNADRRSGDVVDMLVLHYTGMRSGEEALQRLCDPEAKVSAHYLIEEDGTIFSLVPESARAWHAGLSEWRGCGGINDRSIGVEIVNPGHEYGYRAFPQPQMESLIRLCREILERRAIPARHIVGHSDIAPWRKEDPGELFDWPLLAAQGIGLFPLGTAQTAPQETAEALLTRIGYKTSGAGASSGAALRAFQRRFQPDRLGNPGTPFLLQRLKAVAEAFERNGG